jgi:fumarate hydratase, class I
MPFCATVLAEENIEKVECIDFPDLGTEAAWTIEVEHCSAFLLVDDK